MYNVSDACGLWVDVGGLCGVADLDQLEFSTDFLKDVIPGWKASDRDYA